VAALQSDGLAPDTETTKGSYEKSTLKLTPHVGPRSI
jgi:hypothetical protein